MENRIVGMLLANMAWLQLHVCSCGAMQVIPDCASTRPAMVVIKWMNHCCHRWDDVLVSFTVLNIFVINVAVLYLRASFFCGCLTLLWSICVITFAIVLNFSPCCTSTSFIRCWTEQLLDESLTVHDHFTCSCSASQTCLLLGYVYDGLTVCADISYSGQW